MIAPEEITQIPEEQGIIKAFDLVLPAYYKNVPYHNYAHPRDKVLPEVLRLDDLGRQNAKKHAPRRVEIAAALGHDIYISWSLDPDENFSSKEERSAETIRNILPEFDYKPEEIEQVSRDILSTETGKNCLNQRQIRLRRGDLVDVAGSRQIFLTDSVKIFYEHVQTQRASGFAPLEWPVFIQKQQQILRRLLSQDLTLPFEYEKSQTGVFNRVANRNVSWLSSDIVLNPIRFVQTYGRSILDHMPGFSKTEITNRAAA